ncbi:MAG TPA: phosphatase PAP2 family protein [Candidatus Saccharimonadales bacterium]|nr:phosphatase PAP2 family protein [Candidatus Saccharimonadales bacterium]
MKINRRLARSIGLAASLICIGLFAWRPSFPTPDKLLIFLFFIFMAFNQALAMLKRIAPFVLVLLAYESFRSVADRLNSHVNYYLSPHMDHLIFGQLPTVSLQQALWHGRTSWYDYVFYLAYMAHFIIPLALALIVWKTRESQYWRVVGTYLVTAFGAFLTFFLLPAAPPWLASQNHYIQPITRISSQVWAGLGLKNFPSFYNHIAANPVAALPSLHAAWATVLIILVYKLYGWRWSLLAAIYPFLIYLGTVYEGEHYVFDIICGIVYAVVGYLVTPYVIKTAGRLWGRLSLAVMAGWRSWRLAIAHKQIPK